MVRNYGHVYTNKKDDCNQLLILCSSQVDNLHCLESKICKCNDNE